LNNDKFFGKGNGNLANSRGKRNERQKRKIFNRIEQILEFIEYTINKKVYLL
jgi:hypothetical protein